LREIARVYERLEGKVDHLVAHLVQGVLHVCLTFGVLISHDIAIARSFLWRFFHALDKAL